MGDGEDSVVREPVEEIVLLHYVVPSAHEDVVAILRSVCMRGVSMRVHVMVVCACVSCPYVACLCVSV